MPPLNPTLYRRLQRHFGHVRISAEGEAMIYRAVRGFDDEPRILVDHPGEYYKVCCPYCNDTRFRLEVSHMYGQVDGHNRRMTFLANCFNEGCLSRQENWDDFTDKLGGADLLETWVVKPGREVPPEARVVLPPGPCTLLSELPETHHCRQYVELDRGFNPDDMARVYGAAYCENSHYRLAQDRLYIPVFDGPLLKGWQCRYIGELDWKTKDKERKRALPPKYFSCPGSHFRSQCIYNWDRMKQWQTGIIVEGPTDVWRFGAMSGCIFGNTITSQQKKRLLSVFRRRSLVLLLDPEEYDKDKTRRTIEEMMTAMPRRFCALKLHDGSDPGSLDRAWQRAWVKQEAEKLGVEVSYEKALAV